MLPASDYLNQEDSEMSYIMNENGKEIILHSEEMYTKIQIPLDGDFS